MGRTYRVSESWVLPVMPKEACLSQILAKKCRFPAKLLQPSLVKMPVLAGFQERRAVSSKKSWRGMPEKKSVLAGF